MRGDVRELVLVRHGETAGQSSIRLNGSTDVALSPLGRDQMRSVGSALSGERYDEVIVSPLVRSRESAELAYGAPTRVVEDFREIDFGLWETLTYPEAAEQYPDSHAEWSLGEPGFRFPGGESRIGFFERVRDATLRELSDPPTRTLAVLHKGVSKIILATLLELEWDTYRGLPCDLASIHRLRRESGRWVLLAGNQVDHLGDSWIADHPAVGRPTSTGCISQIAPEPIEDTDHTICRCWRPVDLGLGLGLGPAGAVRVNEFETAVLRI